MKMILRDILVLWVLLPAVIGASVDIKVTQVKAVGKTGSEFRLTGKCLYTDAEPAAAGDFIFSVQLDRPSTNFKSKQATVLSTRENAYTVTNAKVIKGKRLNVIFTVNFNGSDSCFPSGTCTSLEKIPTTSSTSSTSTTTAPEVESPELLQNTDMESNFTGNWFCYTDCTLEHSDDSYTGARSAKITNRNKIWKGLSQIVNITAGRRYRISGYIKLLNVESGAMYHTVEMLLYCINDQGDKKYIKFGTSHMQPFIWTEIGGIRDVPSGYNIFRVYISVSGPTVKYVADDLSMREIPDLVEWRTEAEARIEMLRKADIEIRVTSADPLPSNLSLEVIQKKHKFGFGSVVGYPEIIDTDPTHIKYQDWFYEHFEWGMPGNVLKWKPMERKQGEPDYERPTEVINALESRGIRIRAHNMFWGFEKNVPTWVLPLNASDLYAAMVTRVNGLIGNTTGHLEHWAVNNENTHGDFFERRTGDANITMQMFRDIHAVDSSIKLFLNDYGIVETSGNQKATAIKVQAQMFRDAGVPIHGIGVQSHISKVEITNFKARLDKVAEAGLPMWISELSMIEPDENIKAQALEDVLTLYFSHPSIEGIMLWGFWDGRIWKINATLVEGPDMTPNAAGRAYQRLFKQTWRTRETIEVIDDNPISFRGFKGEYSVKVKQNDTLLKTESFVLDDAGINVDINLP